MNMKNISEILKKNKNKKKKQKNLAMTSVFPNV